MGPTHSELPGIIITLPAPIPTPTKPSVTLAIPGLPLRISLWPPPLQGSRRQGPGCASCGPAQHPFQTQAGRLRWTERRPEGQDSHCQCENWEGRKSLGLHTGAQVPPPQSQPGATLAEHTGCCAHFPDVVTVGIKG